MLRDCYGKDNIAFRCAPSEVFGTEWNPSLPPLLVIPRALSTFRASMCFAKRVMNRVSIALLALFVGFADAAEKKAPFASNAPDVVALTERAKKSVVVITHYGRDGKQNGV